MKIRELSRRKIVARESWRVRGRKIFRSINFSFFCSSVYFSLDRVRYESPSVGGRIRELTRNQKSFSFPCLLSRRRFASRIYRRRFSPQKVKWEWKHTQQIFIERIRSSSSEKGERRESLVQVKSSKSKSVAFISRLCAVTSANFPGCVCKSQMSFSILR